MNGKYRLLQRKRRQLSFVFHVRAEVREQTAEAGAPYE